MTDADARCGVLIVDDDKDIRDSIAEILEDERYTISQAANGAEALLHLRSDAETRVIILDLMMPVMDRWQFRNVQLQNRSLAEIPVLVLTADGNAKQKAAQMNALDGISKPVRADHLLSAVARAARAPCVRARPSTR